MEVGLDLVLYGMTVFIGPTTRRPLERHFSTEALRVTYGVANFPAHAERAATGVMKHGRFITGKLPLTKLNLLVMAVQALAAKVNLTSIGFEQ